MRSNLPWFHIIGALFCEMPSPWFCEMDTLFCKLRQADFARDERSNLDFKNCSDIGAVTWLIICLLIFTFQTFGFFTPPYYQTKPSKKSLPNLAKRAYQTYQIKPICICFNSFPVFVTIGFVIFWTYISHLISLRCDKCTSLEERLRDISNGWFG